MVGEFDGGQTYGVSFSFASFWIGVTEGFFIIQASPSALQGEEFI
ncbi:MAG: hypothetical protein AAFQ92_15325 [Bacteroidota bacterium]